MRSEAVDKEVIHSLKVYGIHESFARHLVSLLAVLTSLRGDDPQDYQVYVSLSDCKVSAKRFISLRRDENEIPTK